MNFYSRLLKNIWTVKAQFVFFCFMPSIAGTAKAASVNLCQYAFTSDKVKEEKNSAQHSPLRPTNFKELYENLNKLTGELSQEKRDVPSKKAKLISQSILIMLNTHLNNKSVETNFLRTQDPDLHLLQITPVDPKQNPNVHPFNRLAFRIYQRFGYTLTFSPWDLHHFSARGFCRTTHKTLGMSYEMILSGKIDGVMIHEIRHMYQDFLAQQARSVGGKTALQLAEFRPLQGGSLPFQVEGYPNYLRLDESMSHLGDLIYHSRTLRKKSTELLKAEQTLSLIKSIIGSYDLKRSNLKAIFEYQNTAQLWNRLTERFRGQQIDSISIESEIQGTNQKLTEMEQIKKNLEIAIQTEKVELDRLTHRMFPNHPVKVELLRKIAQELEKSNRLSEVMDASQWNVYNAVSEVRFLNDANAPSLVLSLPILSRDRKVYLVFLAHLRENALGQSELVYQYVFNNSKPIDGPGYMIQLVVTDPFLVASFKNQMESLKLRGAEDYINQKKALQTSRAVRFQEVYDHATKMMGRMGTMGKQMNAVLNKLDLAIKNRDAANYTQNLRELRAVLLQTYYPK
jgi:hypothetical protein